MALIEHVRPEADLAKIVGTGPIRNAIINGKRPQIPKNSKKSVTEYKRGMAEWFSDTLDITWDTLDPFILLYLQMGPQGETI